MPRFRVLVCGGRRYQNRALVFEVLDKLAERHPEGLHIIQGGATGADTWANQWRLDRHHPGQVFHADWRTYGQSAGPIRNRRMLVEGEPDLVLAFPGGRGTRNMMTQALGAGVEVRKVGELL